MDIAVVTSMYCETHTMTFMLRMTVFFHLVFWLSYFALCCPLLVAVTACFWHDQTVDLVKTDATEEEKLAAVMQQGTDDFKPSKWVVECKKSVFFTITLLVCIWCASIPTVELVLCVHLSLCVQTTYDLAHCWSFMKRMSLHSIYTHCVLLSHCFCISAALTVGSFSACILVWFSPSQLCCIISPLSSLPKIAMGRGRGRPPQHQQQRLEMAETPPPNYTCNNCGVKGHYIRNCPHPKVCSAVLLARFDCNWGCIKIYHDHMYH